MDSNRGPSVRQPNALPLGQTDSQSEIKVIMQNDTSLYSVRDLRCADGVIFYVM